MSKEWIAILMFAAGYIVGAVTKSQRSITPEEEARRTAELRRELDERDIIR